MAERWSRRREPKRRRPVRRVRPGARAEGGAEEAADRGKVAVPVLGPYEIRYDVREGYTEERVVDVR